MSGLVIVLILNLGLDPGLRIRTNSGLGLTLGTVIFRVVRNENDNEDIRCKFSVLV